MVLICCVDKNWGMSFNGRRQSKDKEITKRILRIAKGGSLYVSSVSLNDFLQLRDEAGENQPRSIIIGSLCNEAPYLNGVPDYLLLDVGAPESHVKHADKIVIFRWDKVYPASVIFPDISLDAAWKLESTTVFSGNSHEEITEEIYTRVGVNDA